MQSKKKKRQKKKIIASQRNSRRNKIYANISDCQRRVRTVAPDSDVANHVYKVTDTYKLSCKANNSKAHQIHTDHCGHCTRDLASKQTAFSRFPSRFESKLTAFEKIERNAIDLSCYQVAHLQPAWTVNDKSRRILSHSSVCWYFSSQCGSAVR